MCPQYAHSVSTMKALGPVCGHYGQPTEEHTADLKCKGCVGPTILGPGRAPVGQPTPSQKCGHTVCMLQANNGDCSFPKYALLHPQCAYSMTNVSTVCPMCPKYAHTVPIVPTMCPQCQVWGLCGSTAGSPLWALLPARNVGHM